MNNNPNEKPKKAIGIAIKNGKVGVVEFDVIMVNGEPHIAVAKHAGGVVESRPLDKSRLFDKNSNYDYFYIRPIELDDKPVN